MFNIKIVSKENQFCVTIKSFKNINFRMFPTSEKHLFASHEKRRLQKNQATIIGNDKLVMAWLLRAISAKMLRTLLIMLVIWVKVFKNDPSKIF